MLYSHLWRVLMRSGKGHLRASLHAVFESEEVAKAAPARDYPRKSSRNSQYSSQFFAMSAIIVVCKQNLPHLCGFRDERKGGN